MLSNKNIFKIQLNRSVIFLSILPPVIVYGCKKLFLDKKNNLAMQ